jgi:hypothetical protein
MDMSSAKQFETTSTGVNIPAGKTYRINDVPMEVIYSIKKHISIDSIDILYARPLILIPAPGSGYVIKVIEASVRVNFVTTALDPSVLMIKTKDCSPILYTNPNTLSSTSTIINTMVLPRSVSDWTSDSQIYLKENQPVFVGLYANDNVNGDGSIDIYVSYRIITL